MVRDNKSEIGGPPTPLTVEPKAPKKEGKVARILRNIFLAVLVIGIIALFVAMALNKR